MIAAFGNEELTKKKLMKLGILDNATNANISNADLSECSLINHDFSGADLTGANLTNSIFINCRFDRAIISTAKFDESVVEECSFSNVTGRGTSFIWTKFLGDCNFTGSNLSDFINTQDTSRGVTGIRTTFEHAIAYGINFTKCDLSNVELHQAQMREATFTGAKINALNSHNLPRKMPVREALLNLSNFKSVTMQNTALSFCRIDMADFSGSDLSGLSLAFMTLWHTNFSHSNLSEVSVSGDVIFDRAILRFCNLSGADLSQAISLETAKLEGSTYNKSTKFPPGFDPTKHGLTLK